MSDIFLYGLLALVGVLLVVLFWRRGELAGRGTLSFAGGLPSAPVVDRLFSHEDLRYAESLPQPLYRLFVRDRQAMAMGWIRQIRFTGLSLVRQHVKAARRSASLQIWREAQIAARFLVIVVACELLALALVTLGPAGVRSLINFLRSRISLLQLELGAQYLAGAESA
ncbi:MAG TPA: hypothetical protein VMI06_01185 [Terriglobia bacterium]|nr:hypothetical protein [Terriglobia bacterium]